MKLFDLLVITNTSVLIKNFSISRKSSVKSYCKPLKKCILHFSCFKIYSFIK